MSNQSADPALRIQIVEVHFCTIPTAAIIITAVANHSITKVICLNNFFLSRHFQWEHNGSKYTTTDEKLNWEKATTCGRECKVFHNGKIWAANDYYYPRIQLTRVKYYKMQKPDDPHQYIEQLKSNIKWTDIKYLRNFKKIY